MILLVTHQCSYLCHIIQTVENILPCFLRLNPRLCLMIIWCLLKTGERRWPELPSNQLWITCYLQLMPHPALIRDHYMPLAWALSPLWLHDTFCVIWRFLFSFSLQRILVQMRTISQIRLVSQRFSTPCPSVKLSISSLQPEAHCFSP